MEIVYAERFYKELSKLPARVQQSVKQVLIKLKAASNLESSGVDYALMRGRAKGAKYYRIRVGDYRIGVKYIHPDMIVIIIARRGEIYKLSS
ncbi:hypothetical protein [Dyadobacter sp. 676]|jgi:mRNA interferase RelE/StbE|uniref:Type II toxin-antitoxin system RelE/ParE family toxin n=1 Tax=Dyadobacter sp. 676 TaxID=3088362 RepID=A0AAU8FFM1_9BACT